MHDFKMKISKILLFLQKLTISLKQSFFRNKSTITFIVNFIFFHLKIFKTIRKINKNVIDLIDNDNINTIIQFLHDRF